jgi:leucyl aminopeptidase (aminopeptidase T)
MVAARKSWPPPSGSFRVRSTTSPLRVPDLDFDVANAARRVIEGSLGVVAGECVAIVADRAREPIGVTLAEVARSVGAEAELVVLESVAVRPARSLPDVVRALLERAQASVLLIGFEDGERPMRHEYVTLAADRRLRHAHMIGVGRRTMLAGFSADPGRILDATRAVRTRLRPNSLLRLRSPAGSDLEIRLDPRHRWQERVGIVRPGRWENLPSGELFTCPGDVNGVFVADASLGGHLGAAAGVLGRSAIRVEIKSGTCRAVQSVDRTLARSVEELLRSEPNSDRVGTIIVGTNVGTREPTGELLCDQNLPGLHIAFGATFPDLTGASWDAPTQLAMTATQADLDLDGVPILRQGRYLVL